MRSVTLNFADWLEAIFCHFLWHIFWHSLWHIFWHSFIFFLTYLLTFFLTYLLTYLLTLIAVEVRRGTLISQDPGWGPARNTELTLSRLARNTELTRSRLRSGAEHWPHTIVVEVRRGTLSSHYRGWGPARNTELTGSRLRSGTEHWTHRIAVDVRQSTLNSQATRRRRRRRRKTAHIKSNNPHLTGGEITSGSPVDYEGNSKRNSLPRRRIHTTLQKHTITFVLVNLWVKKLAITMAISDESHWSMSQRWLLLFHRHTPCLWQKCFDWLVGTAAPHRKWRLHSFPSACRWSLILAQLSGTFTKRWNPAAELCKILHLWRDDRYQSSTNQSWITRGRCTAIKSFNQRSNPTCGWLDAMCENDTWWQ